jgi:hypothetical protein
MSILQWVYPALPPRVASPIQGIFMYKVRVAAVAFLAKLLPSRLHLLL